MRIDGTTVSEMFAVLHGKIVASGPTPNTINFYDDAGVLLCAIPFSSITEDTEIPGEFHFQDQYGSNIIRALVGLDGVPVRFTINDATTPSTLILDGDVSLLNAGGDIQFNSTDWVEGQIAISSLLTIIFSTEG